MTIDLTPPFMDLTFMSPLSDSRAERLLRFLANGEPAVVLDVGCGWAELLVRAVVAAPGCRGVGIDRDVVAIEHGRQLAVRRGVDDRVTLIVGDVSIDPPESADAVICLGASQIWGDDEEDGSPPTKPLDYRRALTALRNIVPRRGRVVYGEAIWSAPPTAEAIAPLAGRLDEFVMLPDLVETAVECGFVPMAVHEADAGEWDTFESGYSACFARWLADHDTKDPDADEVRERAQRQRAAYLQGYRGILGMAYLELVAV